jgi:hypothetical protein
MATKKNRKSTKPEAVETKAPETRTEPKPESGASQAPAHADAGKTHGVDCDCPKFQLLVQIEAYTNDEEQAKKIGTLFAATAQMLHMTQGTEIGIRASIASKEPPEPKTEPKHVSQLN